MVPPWAAKSLFLQGSAPHPNTSSTHRWYRWFHQRWSDTCIVTCECLAVHRAAPDEGLESQQGMCGTGMNYQCHAWQHANQSNIFSTAVWCYHLRASLEMEGEMDILEDLSGKKKCRHFSVSTGSSSLRKAIVAGFPTSRCLSDLWCTLNICLCLVAHYLT